MIMIGHKVLLGLRVAAGTMRPITSERVPRLDILSRYFPTLAPMTRVANPYDPAAQRVDRPSSITRETPCPGDNRVVRSLSIPMALFSVS